MLVNPSQMVSSSAETNRPHAFAAPSPESINISPVPVEELPLIAEDKVFKGLNDDDRYKLCHEQIAKWQKQLAGLSDEISGTGNNANMNNVGTRKNDIIQLDDQIETPTRQKATQ